MKTLMMICELIMDLVQYSIVALSTTKIVEELDKCLDF